jgi:hypothetical protein
MGQVTTRSRSGQGHTLAGAVTLVTQVSGHEPQARCGMRRDGGQFGCGRVYFGSTLRRHWGKQRMWTHGILVTRCNKGETHTLFQRLREDPVKHKAVFPDGHCRDWGSWGNSSQYSVWLQTGWREFDSQQRQRFLLYPLSPDQLWGPLSLLLNGHRGSFPCG